MEEVTGGWTKLYVEKLNDVDSSVISLISEEVWDLLDMWHILSRWEKHTEFWLENLKEGDYLENLEVAAKIILKWFLNSVASSGARFIAVMMGDQQWLLWSQ